MAAGIPLNIKTPTIEFDQVSDEVTIAFGTAEANGAAISEYKILYTTELNGVFQ